MFNNNSQQNLQQQQNSQRHSYSTRGNSQNMSNNGPTNIFNNNQNNQTGNNYSNQNQSQNLSNNGLQNNSTTTNIFQNNQGSKNLFQNNQGSNSSPPNIFLQGNSNQNYNSNQYQQNQAKAAAFRTEQELTKVLRDLFSIKDNPEFHKLILLLDLTINRCKNVLERATRETEKFQKEASKEAIALRKKIKERCLTIKERNSLILIDMLNLKQKIAHIRYQQKIRNQQGEVEMDRMIAIIRESSTNISQKKNQLLMQRQFNKPAVTQQENTKKIKSIEAPMK